MGFTKESSVERAKNDLAKRLNISVGEIEEIGVSDKDFPDMLLGSPASDEMAAQMISTIGKKRLPKVQMTKVMRQMA